MATEDVAPTGFVDRRSGRRGTRLDRKRRGIAEVAPTKPMMIAEFMNRYRWVAYCVLAVSTYVHYL